MKQQVDRFFDEAGRWSAEMATLRPILRETKLDEELKWGKPTYSIDGHNIVIIQPFKKCLAMMFFKGTLLADTKGLLIPNGPNSRHGKRFEFHSPAEISKLKATIKAYIKEAVAIEAAGEKVPAKTRPASLPPELKQVFAKKPAVKAAFGALTPGRQRAYILHFSGAKQSATRTARIMKCLPAILAGKGLMDR